MQGYTWGSNQHSSQRYQDRPPPQYQERLPPQYHERSPSLYQGQFPPNYHAVRNNQSCAFQVQHIPQQQTTLQTRYLNGQQEAANQGNACSGSADSTTFQQNSKGYDWLKLTNHIQHQSAASQTPHHYPPDNPNAYRYHAQWHDSSPQNYRNTGCSQALVHWTPQSDHGSSVGNSRGWSSHISNNGSSCSMNNQQQFQAPRMGAYHHHQQHQEISRQYSGQKRQKHHAQSSSRAYQKIPKTQAQSRTKVNLITCDSTTPPSGANHLNQSPIYKNRPELGSNACPDVLATQPQNNQNAGQQSQGTNIGICNVNQTSQRTQTSEAKLQPHTKTNFNVSSYADLLIYRLLCSNGNGQSDSPQNTCPEQLEVHANKKTDSHSKEAFSDPSANCTVEPPSKRMKNAVIQRDCWNKVTVVAKDKSDFGVQSAQTDTHQTGIIENRRSQHKIQYSADPADCLEVVFALQKAAQQSLKAIAIVPPISQQVSNAAPTADISQNKAESPPLKIDCVWSLVDESNEQATLYEKLSESSLQVAQQDNKSFENTTECHIADPNACSVSPAGCENDVQQNDCDSSDFSYDLSSVPLIEHTLDKLMDLVKSLEKTEIYPEYSDSVSKRILKLYWNGNPSNVLESLKSFGDIQQSCIAYARDYSSVVCRSIETENLKKLAHYDILKNEMYSSSEEFKSSWLNVDGLPADIEKVLSEPLLNDSTVFKATSQTSSSLGVNSLADMPEISEERSVNPHTSSPTELFKQKAGNDSEEVTAGNNEHSHVESKKETFKKKEDINQNLNFNTELSDISPLAERPTEKPADLGNAKEVITQDHEQTRDNVSASLSLSPGNSASDGKNSKASFSISTDTLQVEDISNDENPGNKEASNNSSDTWLVEDISDNDNSGSKEVFLISSNIWQVEDISDNDNQGNMDTASNTSDICVVEDVSADENLSDDSLFMGITVLSKEDAKTFFQLFEKESDRNINTKSQSNLEQPDLVECFDAYSQPKHKYNKANTCFCCGTETAKSSPSNVSKTDSDADFFCPDCWKQAPLFELEEEPYEAKCSGSAANPKKLGQNYSMPCLKLEVSESNLASTKECIAYEGQKSDCLLKSKLELNCSPPFLETEVKKSAVASNDECTEYEGWAGQKSAFFVKSEQGHDCSPPSVELKDKKPNVALPETCIAEQGLTEQKRDCMVESELVENCSQPSLKLKIKKPTVASTKECSAGKNFIMQSEQQQSKVVMPKVSSLEECIADEGLQSPKRNIMAKSEMGQNCSSPSLGLKVKESNFVLQNTCIADEGQIGKKSDCIGESELGHSSPQRLKLEVKEPTAASAEGCITDKGLTGQKSDSMEKSKKVSKIQGSAERELTKIQPSKQKNVKTEKIRVPKPQSLMQCRKPISKKIAFSRRKLKSGNTNTGADDSVLFSPDIVVKMNWPQKKKIPANKRRSGESQNHSNVKKFKEHRQERQDNPDRTSTNHRENLQKKTEKVSSPFNDTPPKGSENKLELHGILSVKKITSTEPKKVRFDLYGSKTEKQYYVKERRFSAPATLTVSDCTGFTDVLSAKQKVLNQWSSTFIPKTKKTCPPKSPQKKKTQKPQDLLKSNMSALKIHLTHRAKLSSSSDTEKSHFRKPFFHQKLWRTLSS
ncbi:uncharacterized protein LOC122343407 [Puntigrus tetrazona]|uniref:uncharacterized protein LOC122343407 n=1 Tax=Puntigrus tetrazona TaxID=1606681 RepID=UPI001C8A12F1|nr:uncharacterized protein LOC122343407 [Puntigrus tetrazona]